MGRRALTTDEFVKRAREIHGDRYDYSLVEYVNNKTPVIIICSEHGVFEQRPDNHVDMKQGCLQCGIKQRNNYKRLGNQNFITRAREIHGDRYDYSMVICVNARTPVMIICPEHGMFEQRPYLHLKGQCCPQCAIERQKLTIDEFIACTKEIHGDRYDYSMVIYVNAHTPVMIICPEHGMFEQTPNNHRAMKHGCPKCAQTGFNPSKPGTLYVLADDKQCPTLLKIGITNNLKQRLRQLRHTTPHPVVKITMYTFSHGGDAYKLEQEVHKFFHELNAGMNGFNGATEWFKYSPAIIDYIRDTIRFSSC